MRPRRRRVALGLLAVVATVGLIVGVVWSIGFLRPSGVPSGPGGQPADASTFVCPEPCDRYTIAFAGDTMIGDGARKRIKKKGYGYVLEHVPGLLQAADYAIINAEAPITTLRKKNDPDRKWSYSTEPAAARALAEAGVDAFGFANNHTFDRGVQGIEDTRVHSAERGLAVFGAGLDADEAEAPLLLETPYGTVAVVGVQARHMTGEEAGPEQPGTPQLRPATLRRLHQRARDAGAAWVVAFVHWGSNYLDLRPHQKRFAGILADVGFDLVIGHGPHVIQPVGRFDGVPIVYSLGNFVFNSPGRYRQFDNPGYGMVATAFLGPAGFEGLELRCVQADNKKTKYRARPCDDAESADAYARLGAEVRVRDGLGVVTW